MNGNEQLERLIRAGSEMRLLTQKQNLTEQEQDRLSQLVKEFDERESLISGRTTTYRGDNMRDADRPGDDHRVWETPVSPFASSAEVRGRALEAVERMGHASDSTKSYLTDQIEHNDGDGRLARFAAVASDPAYVRAFERAMLGQQHLMTDRERFAVDNVRTISRAMSLTDTSGGFLVPFQLDPAVLVTSNGSTNPIRQAARKVMATGDVWNGVSSAAVSWSWDAEAAEVSDDATTFAGPAITIHKAAGFVPISLEGAMDMVNVAGEVGKLLAFGKDTLESAAFATGSGSGQPFGIITALSGTSSEVTATTRSAFGLVDLFALDENLPARFRGNGTWLANRAAYNDVRQFDTNGGAALWTELGPQVPSVLLGRNALECSDMTATVTTGNHYLVFGDMSSYVIADRIGTTVEYIPHLFATGNNRPSGQRGWYAFYRVGADSVNDGAFRTLLL